MLMKTKAGSICKTNGLVFFVLEYLRVKKKYLTHSPSYCKMQKSAVVCLYFIGAPPRQSRDRNGAEVVKTWKRS